MGRSIPLGDDPLIYPALSLSLLVAGMVATIALVTGLCAFRRKPSPNLSSSPATNVAKKSDLDFPPPSTTADAKTATAASPPSQASPTDLDAENTIENTAPEIKELPLPPARKALRETYSYNYTAGSESSKKLNSTSMSMKVSRSMSVSKIGEDKQNQRKKGKLKPEDSIWTKTIILGEKCKVPDEEDEPVVYDGKGHRISTYHPRNPSSISISRTSSFIDQNAIPEQEKEKGITSKEQENS